MQTQLTVPIRDGYDFGVGADLLSGAARNQAVEGAVTLVEHAGGSIVNFTVQRCQTTEDLEQALGIDAEASYGSPSFGDGISDRFKFARNSKIQKLSLFMTVTATIKLGVLSIDAPALTEEAKKLVDRQDIFSQRFGDVFVRSMERGGVFVGVLRIDVLNEEESRNIDDVLQGSYGLFSAKASEKFAEVQKRFQARVFVQMYHEGGPVDLAITDPTNPLELLKNANIFLSSFKTNPDASAVPYTVTLAPITIASGPLPPNAADLEHAQDVMRFCTTRRSILLDQSNLLQLIVDRPTRFDFSNGSDLKEIAAAAAATQADLDLVAQCVSSAMNHPAGAKFPADFASAKGERFPLAVMPSLLPVGKPAPPGKVRVPSGLIGRRGVDAQKILQGVGLNVVFQLLIVKPEETADDIVTNVIPIEQTEVDSGATVTLVTKVHEKDIIHEHIGGKLIFP